MNETVTDLAERIAAVRRQIGAGTLDEAATEAEAICKSHPGDLRGHFVWCEVLDAQKKHATAAAHCIKILDRWPNNQWILARLVALTAKSDIDAAVDTYRRKVEPAPLAEADKTRIARNLAAADRRHPDAAAILESRLAVTPDDPALLREVASSFLGQQRFEEAVALFERSHEIEPLPGWGTTVYLNALLQGRRQAGRYPVVDEKIHAVLNDGVTRFPDDPLFVRTFNRLPVEPSRWRPLYDRIRANFAAGKADGMMSFEMAKAAFQAGETDEARRILATLDPASHWGAATRPLAKVLDRVPEATWRRARFADDPSAEIQVVSQGSERTIIVFATITGNFMMLPLAALDALLADVPANLVYVRDTVYGSALTGLRSVAPDITSTVAHLERLVAELGTRELQTLGASVSGLSAIRYGARLGARRVATFGALTTVDPDFGGTPPNLQRAMRRRLRQATDGAERFEDVPDELARAPAMRVDLFVGADCKLDREHAERLAEHPQITIQPVADVDHHYVALSLIAEGRFAEAIAGQPG